MRNLIIIIGLFSLLTFTSCEDSSEIIYVYSYPDVSSEVIENSVYKDTYGLHFETMNLTKAMNELLENSVESYNTNSEDSFYGAVAWYEYQYENSLIVDGEQYIFESSAEGEYETILMYSDDEIQNSWIVSGYDKTLDYFRISGQSIRTGLQYSKKYDDSINSIIQFTTNELLVNRINGLIKSGEVNFSYNGVSSYGDNFLSTGKIIYSDYYYIIDYD